MTRFLGMTAACIAFVLIAGLATAHRAHAGPNPNSQCASPTPCLSWVNAGKGEAIDGTGNNNNGLHGVTRFSSTTPANFRAGVLGSDISSSGIYNAGVEGQSTLGFGVMGASTDGDGVSGTSGADGVVGSSTGSNSGVYGYSGGVGVYGSSTNGSIGVLGLSTTGGGIGMEGEGRAVGVQGVNIGSLSDSFLALGTGGLLYDSSNSVNSHVFTVDDGGNTTINGKLTDSGGIVADCPQNQCVADVYASTIFGTAIAGSTSDPAGVGVVAEADGGNGPIFLADHDSMVETAIESNGDIITNGKIYTSGSCQSGCAPPNHPGKRVISYTPRESQPTMEDFGEAQLAGGTAYVRLDASYANVIDPQTAYLVFVTPEGDCNELYVTDRSASGFQVRESHGGRSSVAFSWRIVAKPYGDTSARLPMTQVVMHALARPTHRSVRFPAVERRTPKP